MTIWLGLLIAVVITVGVLISYFVSDYFKETALQRTVDVNANFIMLQASQHLTTNDFTSNNLNQKEKTFSEFFHEIGTSEIARIKVWTPDQTVIYSDDKSIVGKTFDDDELQDALKGKVVSDISDLKNEENVSEKGFDQLMEIYIPVTLNSKVVGVIETYVSLETVDGYIKNVDNMVFSISTLGGTAMGAIIFLTFFKIRKNVVEPIVAMHKQTRRISDGDLNIKSQSVGYEELKNLGNELEVMASKLKNQKELLVKTERLSAIGELAARLAHDLRNPLNVIRTSLFLIRHKYGLEANLVTHFDRIDRSIFRMSHQIESVMDFVTTKPLQIDTVSVRDVLKAGLEKASLPNSVKVNLPNDDILINCDPDKLEVLFENLLINAKQAMKDSGTIDVRLHGEKSLVKIEVEDSGSGISDEILPRIFDPLFTTKQEGTGLGLPSCKNIVEQHGGTIDVKTSVGIGTTFVITLPINKIAKSQTMVS